LNAGAGVGRLGWFQETDGAVVIAKKKTPKKKAATKTKVTKKKTDKKKKVATKKTVARERTLTSKDREKIQRLLETADPDNVRWVSACWRKPPATRMQMLFSPTMSFCRWSVQVTCRSWYEPANSLWEQSPLFQMEVFTANQYLKDLAGKVRSGLEQNFKDKTPGYGRVPFGYRERGRKRNT
tara:strand:- start:56 stop:601 length:546 start_codon:yes stop_codon:yes gene_type:complete